jgi:hypothetical protein
MSTQDVGLDRVTPRAAELASGSTDIYQINDNRGALYHFAPATDGDGWISQDLDDDRLPASDASRALQVALAAVRRTDVLVIGLKRDEIPFGITLRADRPPRRGAWYSLGFLLRGAAARLLDIETDELDVGIRSIKEPDGTLTGQVFLSDSLDNGAGYCTELGKAEVFEELLDKADEWIEELIRHGPDGRVCGSACYECLKDYRNMAYHSLLDWRLAADLTRLLNEGSGGFDPLRLWADVEGEVISDFVHAFEGFSEDTVGGIAVARSDQRCVIAAHPLEETIRSHLPERLADAVVELEDEGFALEGGGSRGRLVVSDFFNLRRRPGYVYDQLWQ